MKTNYVCTVLLLLCVTVCYSCSEKINRQGEILSIDVVDCWRVMQSVKDFLQMKLIVLDIFLWK